MIRLLEMASLRVLFPCLRRQLALGFFGWNVMEVQNRLYSIFGFNLYRLVSGHFRLLNPDVFRPVDEALYVEVRFAADHKIDPVLASFHIGADPHQGQPVSFILVADVGADHFQSNNPSFVVFAEVVKVSDPLFAWNLSRLHVLPPPRIPGYAPLGSAPVFAQCTSDRTKPLLVPAAALSLIWVARPQCDQPPGPL